MTGVTRKFDNGLRVLPGTRTRTLLDFSSGTKPGLKSSVPIGSLVRNYSLHLMEMADVYFCRCDWEILGGDSGGQGSAEGKSNQPFLLSQYL